MVLLTEVGGIRFLRAMGTFWLICFGRFLCAIVRFVWLCCTVLSCVAVVLVAKVTDGKNGEQPLKYSVNFLLFVRADGGW